MYFEIHIGHFQIIFIGDVRVTSIRHSRMKCSREIINYKMIVWTFGDKAVEVVHDGGMYLVVIPGVELSRASQWRSRGSCSLEGSIEIIHCDYAYLIRWLIRPKWNSYMFMGFVIRCK